MKKSIFIILFFFAIVTTLRVCSFFSSMGEDESVYLLMSESILNGHIPYTQVWDHKPPGIYILFAIAQILFGHSIIAIRILTCIIVALTCFVLYQIGNLTDNKIGHEIGLFSGLLYASYSLGNSGIQTNTEMFFNFFVAFAFYLLFSKIAQDQPISSRRSLLIGLLMGFALQIKYVVISELAALFGIVLVFKILTQGNEKPRNKLLISGIKNALFLTIGAFIPFAIVLTFFMIQGHLSDYIYANFTANKQYVTGSYIGPSMIRGFWIQFKSHLFLGLSILIFPFYLFRNRASISSGKMRLLVLLGVWFIMACFGLLLAGRFWNYYFIKLLPSVCLIAGWLLLNLLYAQTNVKIKEKYLALTFILILTVMNVIRTPLLLGKDLIQKSLRKGIERTYDTPTKVANYIKQQLKKEEVTIFVANSQTIIYYLTGINTPTKYVRTAWLYDEEFGKFTGVNQSQELSNILAQKPTYIIVYRKQTKQIQEPNKQVFHQILNQELKENYILETVIEEIELYRIKEPISLLY